jgi:hypothetical protein
MTVGSEIVVPAVRREKSIVRMRPEVSSGAAFDKMASRLAAQVDGLEPQRAREILRHLGRRHIV